MTDSEQLPLYTLDELKTVYKAFDGNLWLIWHECGDRFTDSCRHLGLTKEMMEAWKQE